MLQIRSHFSKNVNTTLRPKYAPTKRSRDISDYFRITAKRIRYDNYLGINLWEEDLSNNILYDLNARQ